MLHWDVYEKKIGQIKMKACGPVANEVFPQEMLNSKKLEQT